MTAGDVVGADLSELCLASLVACNSGAAPDDRVGDDLPHGGFVRAFALAGAHALICAHAPVADAVAAAFVDRFVESWSRDDQDLVAAFVAAQRTDSPDEGALAALALYLLRP